MLMVDNLEVLNDTKHLKGIEEKVEMIFIRAPYVEEVREGVEVIARVDEKIIAVKEKNMLEYLFTQN